MPFMTRRIADLRRHHEGGFTLIEVTLAIAILALVMALAYQVLNTNLTAADRIERVLRRAEVGPAVLHALEQDLRSVLRVEGNAKATFVGKHGPDGSDGDQVDFVSTRDGFDSERQKVCDFCETGFRVERNADGPDLGFYTLYRRFDPFIDSEPLRGGTLIPIYARVKRFALRYYDGTDWVGEWDDKQASAYPKAVEVTLEIGYDDGDEANTELTRFTTVVPIPP